ncbi:MAG: glycosyltransferase family 2 protein [Sphingobacteriaceae bacterium]|nr:glycosyltransferase family 2 protein [Sphingobacteriaceae bacterium]
MEPKVSICIPTYKQTKYLKLCLDSILTQSFKDYEVIISDDTADDTVKDFVSTYKIQNLSYYKNTTSLGTPGNWNSALAKAKGKYIKVMHHDDYFLKPDSLSKFVETAEKSKAGFVFCNTEVWFVSDNSRRISQPNTVQLNRLKEDALFLFFRNKIGAPSATMFLRNNLKFDEHLKWLVDVDFYIQYLKQSSFSYINEALVCTAHETPGQVTQQVQHDKAVQISEHVLVFSKLIDQINDKSKWDSFFGYLFRDYKVNSIEELKSIVNIDAKTESFFKAVFENQTKSIGFKNLIRKLYNSRFNVLKSEQF